MRAPEDPYYRLRVMEMGHLFQVAQGQCLCLIATPCFMPVHLQGTGVLR